MNKRVEEIGLVSKMFVESLEDSINGVADFSDAARALYTSDASNYRQVPLGVVYPADADDVSLITTACRESGLPVLMRGGGTSQNGQCVNNAVILDCSRFMNQVISIDPSERTADVQPGLVCDDLKAAAEVHGLTFGPDPATHSRCTLGGMIGNNSCGPHSMLAGKTVENILELEVLTTDGSRFVVGPTSDTELEELIRRNDRQGEIYRELKAIRDEYADLIREKFPTIKRRVSGYNLDQLLPENGFNVARALVGSEGTCVSVLRAKARLITNPVHKQLIVLGFNTIFDAGDSVPDILPFEPIAMEGLDWSIIGGLIDRKLRLDEVALLPEGKAWILMELAADSVDALAELCERFTTKMENNSRVVSCLPVYTDDNIKKIWSIREQGASATSMSLNPEDPDPAVGWEDTAVDPHQLGDYLREFQALVDRYDYKTSLYGHFGDGCIHARITFNTRTVEGVAKWRKFSEEIALLVVKYGGSLSGEHGDGQAKAEFLPVMFGEELMQAFVRFKKIWDPENRMNPGKLINPYRMDENLRLGPDYKTPQVATVMNFTHDPGGLGRSVERCIGMGKCRSRHGAMCPSYQASNEEKYSTRGRAHLLHELMRGDVIAEGWQDKNVEDSLAHCLSCKACKSECPTKVDIASYKSEFMARHYEGRSRPLAHRVFGNVGNLLPKLSPFARVLNPLMKLAPVNWIVRRSLGVSEEKQLPIMADLSFRQRLKNPHFGGTEGSGVERSSDEHFVWLGESSAKPVVLWLDSFNTHYRPEIIESAIRVLNSQGCKVGIASAVFCCGRPLYEYGFLDRAREQLDGILTDFYPNLPQDADVVVLEPSCLSVFRDELLNFYDSDERAVDLSSRCMTIADLLVKHGVEIKSRLNHGVLHQHCHHKSLCADSSDKGLLSQCFDSLSEPEEGCCGMAGVFGIQARTRSLAKKVFAKKLGPALDQTNADTVIVSNGFSCHEQIDDLAGRKSLHPIQVIEKCLLDRSV